MKLLDGISDGIIATAAGAAIGIASLALGGIISLGIVAVIDALGFPTVATISGVICGFTAVEQAFESAKSTYKSVGRNLLDTEKDETAPNYNFGKTLGVALTAASLLYGGYKLTDDFNTKSIDKAKYRVINTVDNMKNKLYNFAK